MFRTRLHCEVGVNGDGCSVCCFSKSRDEGLCRRSRSLVKADLEEVQGYVFVRTEDRVQGAYVGRCSDRRETQATRRFIPIPQYNAACRLRRVTKAPKRTARVFGLKLRTTSVAGDVLYSVRVGLSERPHGGRPDWKQGRTRWAVPVAGRKVGWNAMPWASSGA